MVSRGEREIDDQRDGTVGIILRRSPARYDDDFDRSARPNQKFAVAYPDFEEVQLADLPTEATLEPISAVPLSAALRAALAPASNDFLAGLSSGM
jgi:hypothetical protein